MKIKYITSAILLCLGMGTISAQETYSSSGRPVTAEKRTSKAKGFDASRIIFGGGLGFGFGAVTNISVSPVVGYRITDQFSAGVGFGYQYLRVKDYFALADPYNTAETVYKPLTATIYSPNVWARYVFYKNLFAHVEYQHNFMTLKEYRPEYDATNPVSYLKIASYKTNINVPSLLVGIGLRQPISDRVSLLLLGLYDVLQKENSPYKGTLAVRFGIVANF